MTPEYILRKSIIALEPERYARDESASLNSAYRDFNSEIENLNYCSNYAESEHRSTRENFKGVIFANWNNIPQRVFDLLEQYGYECEWSDEWSTCDDCCKAIRTSPDSYSYIGQYWITEGSIICAKCVIDNSVGDYLESLEDHPTSAVTLDVDPSEFGYTLQESNFENGFHAGQNDDPEKIHARLKALGYMGIVFKLDSVGQFDQRFSVYYKAKPCAHESNDCCENCE